MIFKCDSIVYCLAGAVTTRHLRTAEYWSCATHPSEFFSPLTAEQRKRKNNRSGENALPSPAVSRTRVNHEASVCHTPGERGQLGKALSAV